MKVNPANVQTGEAVTERSHDVSILRIFNSFNRKEVIKLCNPLDKERKDKERLNQLSSKSSKKSKNSLRVILLLFL